MSNDKRKSRKAEIGRRLRSLRKSRGLILKQIAELFDRTEAGVGKWERGESLPDYDLMPEVAAFYEVSLDWLVTGKDRAPEDFAERAASYSRQHAPASDAVPLKEIAGQAALLITQVYDSKGFPHNPDEITRTAVAMAERVGTVLTWGELEPRLHDQIFTLSHFLDEQARKKAHPH